MRKINKNILISGFYGFGNAGDEAILYAMVKSFKDALPDIGITVLSHKNIEELSPFNIKFVPRKNYFAIIKAMLGADLFISGGGGLIQDITSIRSIKYYLGLINLAKLLGKKTLIYAQGVGPVETAQGKKLTAKTLNKTDYITVRDEYSKNLLLELGVKEKLIEVTADPVLTLDKKADISDILNKYGLNDKNMKLGVSIRPWPGNHLPKIAEFLNLLNRKNPKIKQFLMPFQRSQDLEECKKLKSMLNHNAVIIDENLTTLRLLALISRFDCVIAMRLHAAIMAAVNCVPSLGLIYDPKVRNFFKLAQMPAIALDIINVNLLNENLKYLLEHGKEIKEKLKNNLIILKGKAEKNIEAVKMLIAKGQGANNK